MTKRDSTIFLPQVIDTWGGIENWICGNRERFRPYGNRYSYGFQSAPARICSSIATRLARSGRVPVGVANALLRRAAFRYSGAPQRTYEAQQIDGLGFLVTLDNGCITASFTPWHGRRACDNATEKAQEEDIPHSDMETRLFWRDGRYQQCAPCRWCGEFVQFKQSWKESDGGVRCNRRDCRRIDYLRYKPQSKGGIDLTPKQREALGRNREAWDTQRTINYLLLIAKEAKRGRNPNHDVRRHPPRNHRHDSASA